MELRVDLNWWDMCILVVIQITEQLRLLAIGVRKGQ